MTGQRDANTTIFARRRRRQPEATEGFGTLVYLSYGPSPAQIAETEYALRSAMRSVGSDAIRICLYTDRPQAYKHLAVEIKFLAESEIVAYMGVDRYPHRVKSVVMLDALRAYDGAVIFVDSDTWFIRPARVLFDRVRPGIAVLHMSEGLAMRSPYSATHALAGYCAQHPLQDIRGETYTIPLHTPMWNSGVIGLHSNDRVVLEEALAGVDQVWRSMKEALVVEQYLTGYWFARSLKVACSDDVVYHYWEKSMRAKFAKSLPRLLQQAQSMPPETGATWLHDQRPRRKGMSRMAQYLRRMKRRLGLNVLTTPASWS